MTNITKEGFEQMQANVNKLAAKKNGTKTNVNEIANKQGRPNLVKEQIKLHKELEGVIKIMIKPLSQNDAWKGRRFRSDLYRQYQTDLMDLLPKLTLPNPPYKLTYEFGFSSKGSDIDNPVKSFGDVLQEKYKMNDNQIYEMHIYKKIVKKNLEYVSFKIESL